MIFTVLSNQGDSVIVCSASTAMPPAPLPGMMEEVSKPGIKLPLFLSTAMPQHGLFLKARLNLDFNFIPIRFLSVDHLLYVLKKATMTTMLSDAASRD